MIQSFQFIGQNGNILDLLHNENFYLIGVDGLTSVNADVAASTTPSMDGDTVNSIVAQPRTLAITLRFKQGVSVEAAKRIILSTIKPKLRGRLRMVDTGRTTEIAGLVTVIDMPRFSDAVVMQFQMHCSNPYWQDAEYIAFEVSRVLDSHYFTTSDDDMLYFYEDGIVMGEYNTSMTQTYTNEGDVECGMLITIIALGDVVNPVIYRSDGVFVGVDDTLAAGDQVVINTNKGEKSIIKNGVSVFSKVREGSTFFQLEVGDNELTINSDGGTAGNMYFTLSFKRRFV